MRSAYRTISHSANGQQLLKPEFMANGKNPFASSNKNVQQSYSCWCWCTRLNMRRRDSCNEWTVSARTHHFARVRYQPSNVRSIRGKAESIPCSTSSFSHTQPQYPYVRISYSNPGTLIFCNTVAQRERGRTNMIWPQTDVTIELFMLVYVCKLLLTYSENKRANIEAKNQAISLTNLKIL